MSVRATVIAACIAALGVPIADARSGPTDRDQALRELQEMIAPSPEAERDYAIALAIWQRELGTPEGPRAR